MPKALHGWVPLLGKNVGFPLNLGQLRTYDYWNFTLPTPSGQKFLMKIFIFRLCEIYFALEWDQMAGNNLK